MGERRRFLARLVAALTAGAAFALAPAATAQPAESTARLEGRTLLAELLRGGYIVYFRHTSTDFGQSDEAMADFSDCSKQRNLTDTGRAEARAIGTAIRALNIPIGDVLASPYCRTLETARQMFGRATATPEVRGGPASASPERYADLRRLLSKPVPAGVNLLIVSHGNPFVAVAGPPYLAEGEAAIVEPLGSSGFRVVARVRKDGWAALAAPAR